MNNSFLSLGPDESDLHAAEREARLRAKEEELTKVIKALEDVERSGAWSSLKEAIFDNLQANLEKKIFQEATKDQPDISVLNSLKGEWRWAKRFADLGSFRAEKRAELTSVRKALDYGKQE